MTQFIVLLYSLKVVGISIDSQFDISWRIQKHIENVRKNKLYNEEAKRAKSFLHVFPLFSAPF